MTRRTRKLIGAFVVVFYVIVYALVAMALAQAAPLQEASKLVQGIAYAILGLAWILPLMPLISWMERQDPQKDPQDKA
ncbi:MAG: DUF2842 domain-containing protein [Beijerinckiaceae bacterium]|jgi:hypothetical protein|nr:DUF2842 domain-containing protein [Beijerinckiaceae bacterium]MDO9441131.1 DUF2842 domain-containing protein [Beijerinckiaceae bacterium]